MKTIFSGYLSIDTGLHDKTGVWHDKTGYGNEWQERTASRCFMANLLSLPRYFYFYPDEVS